MGKSKRNNKANKGAGGSSSAGASVPDDDAMSDVTHLSLDDDDLESIAPDQEVGELVQPSADETAEAVLEQKLSDNLENATHKTTSIRLAALKNIQALLSRCIMTEALENWKLTVSDVCEKTLKKGTLPERIVALKIVALLTVQMGAEIADMLTSLLTLLRVHCADPSLRADYRAQCATVIGLCSFISIDELEPLMQNQSTLCSVWKTVKPTAAVTPEQATLFDAVVAAWCLVLVQVPSRRLEEALNTDLPKLTAYLDSQQLEIRIACGEALALLYELGNSLYSNTGVMLIIEGFKPPSHQHTMERLNMLASDSLKYHAKKDRRVQRATFRQIHAALHEGETPYLTIKFGGGEALELDSWTTKLSYDVICDMLSSGMNAHLKKNELLRDIFNLGPPIPGNPSLQPGGLSKSERAIHEENDRLRQQARGKQRGKRLASFSNA